MGTDVRISSRRTLCSNPLTLAVIPLLMAAPAAAQAERKAPTTSKEPITIEEQAINPPDAYKLNMLIRTTLIALNQANQTGNYSVLRDLGTPKFQATNTDAKLAEIFGALRNRKLDLSPLVFFDPKLVRQPAVGPDGMLRLTGFIPTDPQRILFDMGFERVGEQWRLSAIVIDVKSLPSATSEKAPPAKKAEPKAKATPASKPGP